MFFFGFVLRQERIVMFLWFCVKARTDCDIFVTGRADKDVFYIVE